MKKIVAINTSPRKDWNTGTLVREAARGAESEGAEVKIYDLYELDKFTGCVSCFECKLGDNRGKCVNQDGLAPVLEDIRQADGLIIGTPNYLGDASAMFRSLYERLIFQHITFKKELASYKEREIPVFFIMTSHAAEELYTPNGYGKAVSGYQSSLGIFIGPTKVMICGDTVHVEDYDKYEWTLFDAEAKKARRESVFPTEKQKAFDFGAAMVSHPWKE